MELLQALADRVVVADGAMGTLLRARGVAKDACLEELCVSNPDLITQVHRDYLAAGADLIRTHSFAANGAALSRWGLERRVGELNWLAARIARDAVKGTDALVAASVGPTGAGARAGELLEEQVGALLDGGAQCVILETFTDLDEILVALEVKQTLHHCPVVASVVCDLQGDMKGRDISEVWKRLRDAGADIVAINCVGTPRETLAALEGLPMEDCAAFPSAGLPDPSGAYPCPPEEFAAGIQELVAAGVRLVGGCCGTTPEHIAAVASRLKPAE